MAWLAPTVRFKIIIAALKLFTCVSAVHSSAQAEPPKENAQALLAKLAADPQAKVALDYRQRAQLALERAQLASVPQPTAQAKLLEELALRWATAARDLVRAALLEQQANTLEHRLNSAQKMTLRTRALIEETLARKHRAQAALKEAEAKESAPERKGSK